MTVVQVPSAPHHSPAQARGPTYPDWPTLAQLLIAAFPDTRVAAVVREVREAQHVVTSVGLAEAEALEVAEIIARHRLQIATGAVVDLARLDPQRRSRA